MINYHKEIRETLLITKKILDSRNIVFWLEYGTLLGAVRNNNFIEWDKDIDLGIWYHSDEKVKGLKRDFAKAGYYLWHDKNGNFTISKKINRTMVRLVDIFLFKKTDDGWIIRVYKKQYDNGYRYNEFDARSPKEYYREFCLYPFHGENFLIPIDAKQSLEFIYGKEWKMPIKKMKCKGWGWNGRTHHLKRSELDDIKKLCNKKENSIKYASKLH